jgi:multiple sugar transport system substrate-binding protein
MVQRHISKKEENVFMNKRTLTFVMSSAALLMLASCGKTTTSTSSGATDTGSVPDADKITITYESTTGKQTQPYLESYIEEFNKTYPQYKAVPSYYSGSYAALQADVMKGFNAGTYPDLVQCYPDHVAGYLAAGKAVNVQEYIDSTDPSIGLSAEDKADYVDAYMKEGQMYSVPGTYSLPNSKSTELMFYNKGILNGLVLNQAGHVINEGKALGQTYFDNLTWEELFNNLCPALVAYNDSITDTNKKILKDDQTYHGVVGYDSDDNLFITLAEQYGYKYTSIDATTGKGSADFNNADMKALMKVFNKAANDGYIISKGTAGGNNVNKFFTVNNLLFSIGSTGGVKYQFSDKNPMDVGVARIPHAAGKDAKVISQGPSVCVLSHGNDAAGKARAKGAYLLWKTMTSKKNSLNWALNSGYMCIRKSNYAEQEYIDANDETKSDEKTLDRLMARSNTYAQGILNELFTSPVFVGSSDCRAAASAIMTWSLTKGTTYADADYDTEFQTQYAQAVKGIQ